MALKISKSLEDFILCEHPDIKIIGRDSFGFAIVSDEGQVKQTMPEYLNWFESNQQNYNQG